MSNHVSTIFSGCHIRDGITTTHYICVGNESSILNRWQWWLASFKATKQINRYSLHIICLYYQFISMAILWNLPKGFFRCTGSPFMILSRCSISADCHFLRDFWIISPLFWLTIEITIKIDLCDGKRLNGEHGVKKMTELAALLLFIMRDEGSRKHHDNVYYHIFHSIGDWQKCIL
jgi:hypothetical protein